MDNRKLEYIYSNFRIYMFNRKLTLIFIPTLEYTAQQKINTSIVLNKVFENILDFTSKLRTYILTVLMPTTWITNLHNQKQSSDICTKFYKPN